MKTIETAKSYVVREDILPEAILKTVRVKEMLTRGDALTVHEAVEKVGMSRSAFYKYREGIEPYAAQDHETVTAITLILEHRSGILSGVLDTVSSMKGTVESVNQSMPVQGISVITMNVNTTLVGETAELMDRLRGQEGVIRAEIVSTQR